jgi:hypothetical protein
MTEFESAEYYDQPKSEPVPRLLKTIIPRIKKSFARHGVFASIFRSVLLPIQLYREHRMAKELARDNTRSEFDLTYGVNMDGYIRGSNVPK